MLQVQPLRLALTLRLQNPLPRRPKIRHLHPHSPFPKSHQPRLRANRLNIRTTQIIFLIDKLLKIDIFIQAHLACVQSEDLALGDLIGVLEEDLAIDTAGTDQGGVERVDFVGGHDYLDVAAVVETVQLVEEFQHGSLDFALTAGGGFVTFGSYGVDFIDEDDRGGVFCGDLEELE
jgi:hypothetical protein